VRQHARQQPRVRRRDAARCGTGGVAERDVRCVLRRRLHSEGALITIEHLSAGALENLSVLSSANRPLGALRDQGLGFRVSGSFQCNVAIEQGSCLNYFEETLNAKLKG